MTANQRENHRTKKKLNVKTVSFSGDDKENQGKPSGGKSVTYQ